MSSSELLRRQILFARLEPRLIDQAFAMGFEVTDGECWRSDEQALINAMKEEGRAELAAYLERDVRFHGLAIAIKNNGKGNGIALSLHCDRLARDIILRRMGVLCGAAMYRPLAEFWKGLDPLCAAGYDFGDPGHFSVTYQGRR